MISAVLYLTNDQLRDLCHVCERLTLSEIHEIANSETEAFNMITVIKITHVQICRTAQVPNAPPFEL